MTIKRRDFQKAAAMIHEFQLKLSEDSECAELRDALNLALLHMQKYYRTLRNRVQKQENDRTSNGFGMLGASLRGLSPMTPFKDAPDKFQWKWVNLDNVKLSGTLPADVKQDIGVLPKVIQAAKIGDNNRLMQIIDKDSHAIHEVDGLGRNALMYAVHFGQLDTVQILIEQGIDINCAAHDGSTAVHRACHDGNHEALQILIEYEAVLSMQDTQGRAPVHWACAAKDRRCLRLLLDNGCNASTRDKEGMTACMWACRLDHIEHFELLSALDPEGRGDEGEEDGYERDLSGKTWMHWSVRRTEPLECLKTLLTVDSARLGDEEGKTVIHCAAEQGSLPSIKVVLEIAGDGVIEERDDQYRTPLVLATMGGHGEVVNFLLSEGADLSAVDSNGATAWDYARGRQLHYCMLIIASYIRQRAKDRGEEVDVGTLANMTFAGVTMTGTLVNGTYNQHEITTDEDGAVDQRMNGLHINGDIDSAYHSNQPRAAPRQPREPITPRTPRAPVTPRTPRVNVPVTPRGGPKSRGMANGIQPTTPRAPITPRVPTTPRAGVPPTPRAGAGDGFSTARSQKRAPTGPAESSTEDEMVFDKHVRSGSGGKRSRRNGLERQQTDMRVVSVMSVNSVDCAESEQHYEDHENEMPSQSEYMAGNQYEEQEEEYEEEDEDSVSIGAMDVSEVDQDAEDEDEDYGEESPPGRGPPAGQRYQNPGGGSTLTRQSSYHHIPTQAQHQQQQQQQPHKAQSNQRLGNYHSQQQQQHHRSQGNSLYGGQQQQQQRKVPPQSNAGRRQPNNSSFHQPRPPPRHPPYPAHAVKPPPRTAPEVQDVQEEYEEEEVEGYEMPNIEGEEGEESPVSPLSPVAPVRSKYTPPQSGSRPSSGDVRGQTPPAYLQPLDVPSTPTKKKKKKKKKQPEELPPPQAHGWGARPPGVTGPSTHAGQPPPIHGPVPTPRDTPGRPPSSQQQHMPPSQGLKPATLKPPGKKGPPPKHHNELEERRVGFSLPPTPYTLDQQMKPSPPVPVHPSPGRQSRGSAANHPPLSPRAPPLHPAATSQARPRLQRMDAAEQHSDYDTRGRHQQDERQAPPTVRSGSATQRQRYPPPLQNAPGGGAGNQDKGKQVSFAGGGSMFPQPGPGMGRHPPSPRGGRRGNQDLGSGSVPPINQHRIPNGKLPSFGKN